VSYSQNLNRLVTLGCLLIYTQRTVVCWVINLASAAALHQLGEFNCIIVRFGTVSCTLHQDARGRFIARTEGLRAFDRLMCGSLVR